MTLAVAEIGLVRASVPRRTVFEIYGGSFAAADHVFVRIRLTDGTLGYGESAPMAIYSEESPQSVLETLEHYLAPAVLGSDALNLAVVHERMGRAVRMNPIAKAGLDMALHDAIGKSLGVPVHTLLGGAYRDRIPLAESVGVASDDEVVASARAVIEAGFRTIKLKGGRDLEVDVRRVELIRNTVDGSVPIRLDANAGYSTYDRSVRLLRAAERVGLDELEQPLGRFDLEGMARLASDLATPIIADESIFSASDAARIIAMQAADVLNIKVQKAGGFYPALRIAAVAEAASVSTLVGAVQETGIGTAASLHLAAACKTLGYASDARTFRSMVHTLIRNDLTIADGEAYVPMEPGLGVTIDLDALERYAKGPWIEITGDR